MVKTEPDENAKGQPNWADFLFKARPHEPIIERGHKVKRNERCPCGSGLKVKDCHDRLVGRRINR